MKERRLLLRKADLKREEDRSRKAKEEIDAADLGDEGKIRGIQARIRAREYQKMQEREEAEREKEAKIRKQRQENREKWEREAAEALRKRQAEKRAAEQKRQEEETRKWQEKRAAEQKRREEETRKWQKNINDKSRKYREQYTHPNLPEGSTRQAYTSTCRHDGWWSKVQGLTACPKCDEVWTYLLQCPGCIIKACPRCQAAVRPRISRNTARTNRSGPSHVRTPSPDFNYDFW